jgi:hypothetical protein
MFSFDSLIDAPEDTLIEVELTRKGSTDTGCAGVTGVLGISSPASDDEQLYAPVGLELKSYRPPRVQDGTRPGVGRDDIALAGLAGVGIGV